MEWAENMLSTRPWVRRSSPPPASVSTTRGGVPTSNSRILLPLSVPPGLSSGGGPSLPDDCAEVAALSVVPVSGSSRGVLLPRLLALFRCCWFWELMAWISPHVCEGCGESSRATPGCPPNGACAKILPPVQRLATFATAVGRFCVAPVSMSML